MVKMLLSSCLLAAAVAAVAAQTVEPPVGDMRLTVHTLVREDIFAGFLQNDLARLARAEKNLERLLASRPAERASILAWQGSTALTRAVVAHEAGRAQEFRRQYDRANDLIAEAIRLRPDDVGVLAIAGGSRASLADRLPAAERAAAWEAAHGAYQQLWKMQAAVLDKLPLHHKGEVLAGLAQSAQRTGRTSELAAHLERILTLLPGTPYARRAREWKDTPSSQANSSLTCQTCHVPGTLAARLQEVGGQ